MYPTTLDASLFTSGSQVERLRFAEGLISGFKENGFIKLRNHGIPTEVVKDLFTWEKRFFDLPQNTKNTCAHMGGPAPVRGYNGHGQEKSWRLSPGNQDLSDAKDARESFDVGPPSDARYPNVWPSEAFLPTFRQHIESYYKAFHAIGGYLLQAIELGLAIPPGSIQSRALPDSSELRLNHYPSVSTRVLTKTNTQRIWPHTDLGILSLLVQDSEGGLEFEDRRSASRAFVPVHNEEQSDLIVNVSDMLERWTNGVLRAGLHRVSVPEWEKDEGREERMLPSRYSAVFLYRPGEAKSAGPMKDFVSDERPALFDEITALQFLKDKNSRVYDVLVK